MTQTSSDKKKPGIFFAPLRPEKYSRLLFWGFLATLVVAANTPAAYAQNTSVTLGGVSGPMMTMMGPPAPPAIEEGTGAISGVVRDGVTKAPLPDVVVYLGVNGAGIVGSQNRQVTDAKGRFVFVNVPANNALTVSASKPGYLPGGFSRESRPGTSNAPIAVREREWVADVDVPLWKPAAVSGTVTNERGEPVVGVFVRALARVRQAGLETLASGPLTKTDDRGVYRLSGLAPGRYVVCVPSMPATMPAATVIATAVTASTGSGAIGSAAMPLDPTIDGNPQARLVLRNYPTPPPTSDGVRFGYPITFHPSTANVASASAVDLKFGDDRAGVDIQLRPVTTWSISGVVQGPREALTSLTLRLIPQGFDRLGYGSEAGTALVGADGEFTFLNVPDGTYTVEAPRAFSELRMSGAIPAGGNVPPPPRPRGGGAQGTFSDFVTAGPPGLRLESRTFGDSSSARDHFGRVSVTVSGRDESGVVLALKTGGSMSGVVKTDTSGTPAPGATRPNPANVLQLDPADGDPARGPLRIDRPGSATSDQFTLRGLMPGPYFLRATGGWTVKSVRWQGRDYTDAPFDAAATQDISGVEVTLTDAPTLSGLVRNSQGAPAEGAIVVAFPADERLWTNRGLLPPRFASATTSRTGAYRISSLPAGEYVVAVIDSSQSDTRFEPETMRARSSAAEARRVTLTWGEPSTAELSVR